MAQSPIPRDAAINTLQDLFAQESQVLLAYLFGSVARGTAGPMSDLDIAVYLEQGVDLFTYQLRLIEAVSRALKSDRFDLIVLNKAPLLLRHRVIRDGVVLKDAPQLRVEFETRTLREYLDTAYLREVQARIMRAQIAKGTYFG